MDEHTKNQVGSPSRDQFKARHKHLDRGFYACDLDFVLVERDPFPDVIAVLDFKQSNDTISFSETIAYNAMIRRGIPVYIVTGDSKLGRFIIEEYMGGHHRAPRTETKEVATAKNWEEFGEWERSLRKTYRDRFKA